MPQNQNHLLENLDDTSPIHSAILESSREALIEVLKDFVFTDAIIEPIPTTKKGAPFPHNAFFYMNANRMNALVCISLSQEALEKSVQRILGETSVSERDAVDAAQELSNILYGAIKKRMQYQGFSFGLATYQYGKFKPLTPLLQEDVRYGFDFYIRSDLGGMCAKILYDTVSISIPNRKEVKQTVNSTYIKGYQAVRLGEFSSDKKIDFDVFINLRLNNKMLLYKRGGDFISEAIIKRFSSHKIETFYIRDEDNSKFIEYISAKAAQIIKNKDMSVLDKQEKIDSLAKNLISGFFNDPDNAESYLQTAHEVVNRLVEELLADDDPLKSLFAKLDSQLKSMETHAKNVQTLSTVMALVLGYSSERALISISLGSLFHDIGYSKIAPNLHHREESELSAEELAIVRKHPTLGLEILNGSSVDFPYEAKLIVQQHHERNDGSGYPLGLKGFQTYELSKVVAIANEFENMIQHSPGKSHEDIVRQWWIELNQPGSKKIDLLLFKKIFSKLVPTIVF